MSNISAIVKKILQQPLFNHNLGARRLMEALNLIKKNVLSPYKEMLAYETLWALEHNVKTVKEKDLKQWFKAYSPSETLEQMPAQTELFSPNKEFHQIKEKVSKFLKNSLKNELKTLSIVVNKGFQYPENLRNQYPIGLFYCKGNLDILETDCISIVGARKATAQGINKAKTIAKDLCKENYTIVSGLALGIDTAAHQSAMENSGRTIGVIGTPINEYYPKENKELQDKIAKEFLLISQVPFYKYANESFNHQRFHFPRRNMTMASISLATVVIEASDTSGSLVQAKECLKQKRKLFILDSCFKNPKIKWPSAFEKKGAIKVKDTADILKHIK